MKFVLFLGTTCSLLVADLGSEVVLQHAQGVNLVLDDEGLLSVHAESSELGQGGGLVKHVEVTDSELLVDRLGHFEGRLLVLGLAVVGAEFDGAGTDFALDGELHELGSGLNCEGLVQGVQLFANFGEFRRVDGHNGAVFGLGDGEVLDVEGDQVHGELGGALSLGVLEGELKMRGVVFGGESDGVGGVSKFHDLGEHGHVNAQHHSSVGTVVFETFHGEVERNERDVGAVHSLQRKTYTEKSRLDKFSVDKQEKEAVFSAAKERDDRVTFGANLFFGIFQSFPFLPLS